VLERRWDPLTEVGEVTVAVLSLNDDDRVMGEAEVPQNGYTLISNVLKGEVTFPELPKE